MKLLNRVFFGDLSRQFGDDGMQLDKSFLVTWRHRIHLERNNSINYYFTIFVRKRIPASLAILQSEQKHFKKINDWIDCKILSVLCFGIISQNLYFFKDKFVLNWTHLETWKFFVWLVIDLNIFDCLAPLWDYDKWRLSS